MSRIERYKVLSENRCTRCVQTQSSGELGAGLGGFFLLVDHCVLVQDLSNLLCGRSTVFLSLPTVVLLSGVGGRSVIAWLHQCNLGEDETSNYADV